MSVRHGIDTGHVFGKTRSSFHNSIVLNTEVSSNCSTVFQNKGQHTSLSCVIGLDSSCRTGNLMTHCVDCLPDYPEGKLKGNFFCRFFVCVFHSHFFVLPSSNKNTVAAGDFSPEPDMSCVCSDEVMT